MHKIIQPARKGKMFKVGLGLIVLSLVLWVSPLFISFTTLSVSYKLSVAVALLVVAEILFWAGAFFVGREYADKIKSWLKPTNWKRD